MMRHEEIREVVEAIIQEKKDGFYVYRTAYQIFEKIKERDEVLYNRLCSEYGESFGQGAGRPFGPANFIAQSCSEFEKKPDSHFKGAWLDTEGVEYFQKQPGYTGNVVSIWKYKE